MNVKVPGLTVIPSRTAHAPAPIFIFNLQPALSGSGPLVVYGGETQDRQHHNHGQQRVG